jgi:hypothetical protein
MFDIFARARGWITGQRGAWHIRRSRYNESNLPAIRAKRGVGRPPAVHLCRGDHMAREPRTSLGERGAACLRKSKQRRGRA